MKLTNFIIAIHRFEDHKEHEITTITSSFFVSFGLLIRLGFPKNVVVDAKTPHSLPLELPLDVLINPLVSLICLFDSSIA